MSNTFYKLSVKLKHLIILPGKPFKYLCINDDIKVTNNNTPNNDETIILLQLN